MINSKTKKNTPEIEGAAATSGTADDLQTEYSIPLPPTDDQAEPETVTSLNEFLMQGDLIWTCSSQAERDDYLDCINAGVDPDYVDGYYSEDNHTYYINDVEEYCCDGLCCSDSFIGVPADEDEDEDGDNTHEEP